MKKTLFVLIIGTFTILSCEKKSEKIINTEENVITKGTEFSTNDSTEIITDLKADTHTSKNSVDWVGTYEGVLPCADCDGIKTIVELKQNDSYRLTQEYLKKNSKIEEEGKLKWSDDEGKINIETKDNERFQFIVGEGKLILLDQEGNEITGNLADKYILIKK